MLTNKQILRIWNSYADRHAAMDKRWQYYEGDHKFLSMNGNEYGQPKNNDPVNFVESILDAHTALNTSKPYQFSRNNEEDDATPFDNYDSIREENNLDTIDAQHFLNALIFGYSVEVHSLNNGSIKIKKYDPREWSFVFDEHDVLQHAIHKVTIPENTVYLYRLLEQPKTVYTVYNTLGYQIFEEKDGSLVETFASPHPYKDLPIVLFHVNEKMRPFLGDNIIGQNNALNRVVNQRLDEVEYHNSILAAIGFANDEQNRDNLNKVVSQDKAIILPQHSDLKWIVKQTDTQKYREAIDDAREFLFMQGKLPDRKDVQGAIGSLSGEAIKHLYQPTLQQAEFFQRFIKVGLRRRIDLINRVWEIQGKPKMENYNINIDVSLPIDLKNIADTVAALDGIISHRKQLEMLPGVDPETELARLEEQKPSASTPSATAQQLKPLPNQEAPAERAANREQVVSSVADSFKGRLADALNQRRKQLSEAN